MDSRNPMHALSITIVNMRESINKLKENERIFLPTDIAGLNYKTIRQDLSELCINRKRYVVEDNIVNYQITRLADGMSISEFYTYHPENIYRNNYDCQQALLKWISKHKTINTFTMTNALQALMTTSCFKNSNQGGNKQIRYTLAELENLGVIERIINGRVTSFKIL